MLLHLGRWSIASNDRLKHGEDGPTIISMDQKHFTLGQHSNGHSDQLQCAKVKKSRQTIQHAQLHQTKAGGMFLSVVGSDEKAAPPISVDPMVKVNAQA